MQRIKDILKLVGFWIFLLLVMGVIAEIALHFVSFAGKSTIEYVLHPAFGTWRKPNQKAVKVTDCYEVDEILVNSYGMRGHEPNPDKKIKVGLFGDSMVEGIQVNDSEHFVTLLNNANDTVDYLNFATSSTTTVYHLLNLKYHQPVFNLKKAVIFFFPANDIQENSIPLQIEMSGKRCYYPSFKKDTTEGFVLDTDYAPEGWDSGWRSWLRKSYVLNKIYTILPAMQQARAAKPTTGESEITSLPIAYQPYNKNRTPEWQTAYDITDFTILQIKEYCRQQGIELEFVLVPSVGDVMSISEQQQYHKKLFDLLDYDIPYRHYTAFLQTQGIPYIDLFDFAKKRIAKQRIPYPYFSFECDGHYSALGHRMMFHGLKAAGF